MTRTWLSPAVAGLVGLAATVCTAAPAAAQLAETASNPALSSKAAACIARMTPGNWDSCGTAPITTVLLSKPEVAAIANELTNLRAGSKGVIQAWNGAALRGERMWFWGGGHFAYAGNEWYYLDIPSLTWGRHNDPTPADKGADGATNPAWYPSAMHAAGLFPVGLPIPAGAGPDQGGPAPRHTYGGIETNGRDGQIFVLGGRIADTARTGARADGRFGWIYSNLFSYDPQADRWTYHGNMKGASTTISVRLVQDPVSGRMIAMGHKASGTFDPNDVKADGNNNIRFERGLDSHRGTGQGVGEVALLSARERILVTMQKGQFRYWDISDHADGSISIRETGSSRHKLDKQSGMAWHPGRKKMIIWSGWDAVHELDPVTRQLTPLPASKTPGPAGPKNGVHTKWHYYAPLDVFVGYADWGGPAWFYRLPGSPPIAAQAVALEAAPAPEPAPDVAPEPPAAAADLAGLADGDFTCVDGSATPCENLQRLVDGTAAGGTLVLPRGKYASCAVVKRPMTIDLNGSALLGGVCGGKATIVQNADLTLMNGSCKAPGNHGGNLACVRRNAPNLTLRRVYFHDGDEGVLGGVEGGRVLIEDSRFERLGGNGGKSHLIYIGKADELIIRRSHFLCPIAGHAVKSGAKRTALLDSVIDQQDCDGSRAIDAFAGGEVVVRNSTLIKGPKAGNQTLIGYVAAGSANRYYRADYPAERIEVTGSTIACGPKGRVVVVGEGVEPEIVWNANELSGDCRDVPQ